MNPDFLQAEQTLTEQAMAALQMFVWLATEISVLFVAISFLVAILNQKLSGERIRRLLGGRNGRGYLMAAALGSITPFCSCSTIPMLIGLLKARAGFGPTLTFLFTSPLLNPIIITLFVPIFGPAITLTYAVIALGVAVMAGLLLQKLGFERYIRQDLLQQGSGGCGAAGSCSGSSSEASEAGSRGGNLTVMANTDGSALIRSRDDIFSTAVNYRLAWQEALKLFSSMAPYMLVAMAIGALVHGFVPADFFAESAGADNPWAVPTAAVIGIPLYVRVSTLLPLAASLMAKGVSLGAVMALTIGSGGASIPELVMLKRLFRWPMMVAFVSVILFMSIAAGLTFNWLFSA